MKISYIRPNVNASRTADAIHPLELSVLIGLTPKDVDIEVFDERIEDIPLDIDTNLMAITAQTFTARRAYEIADHYRKRSVPVIMGGYHPTFLPEEALQHADSVVIGEAEDLWPTVLSDFREKRLSKVYSQKMTSRLDGVIYDRRFFQHKKYSRIFPVEFNRGCRYDCDFCSVSAFNQGKHKSRPAKDVIEELETQNAKYVMIVDDNILSDKKKTMEFFQALVPLKIKWGCQITLDIAKDDAILKLMAKSGCVAALIGFESLSKENLKQMKKGLNIRNDAFHEDMQKIKDHGIMIYGSFVFGYDFDTEDVFDRTVDFALENDFFLANFNTLTPMPGTHLHARFKEQRRLVREDWWLDKKFQYGEVMFYPAKMTPQALKEGCIRAREKFYAYSSIFKRLFDFKTNFHSLAHMFLFLRTNVIARKEILIIISQIQHSG